MEWCLQRLESDYLKEREYTASCGVVIHIARSSTSPQSAQAATDQASSAANRLTQPSSSRVRYWYKCIPSAVECFPKSRPDRRNRQQESWEAIRDFLFSPSARMVKECPQCPNGGYKAALEGRIPLNWTGLQTLNDVVEDGATMPCGNTPDKNTRRGLSPNKFRGRQNLLLLLKSALIDRIAACSFVWARWLKLAILHDVKSAQASGMTFLRTASAVAFPFIKECQRKLVERRRNWSVSLGTLSWSFYNFRAKNQLSNGKNAGQWTLKQGLPPKGMIRTIVKEVNQGNWV